MADNNTTNSAINGTINNIIQLPTIDTGIILNAIIILLIAYLLVRIITFAITSFSEKVGVNRITIKLFMPLLKFSIYGIALYHIFIGILNISFFQSFVFSGFLGAAIGFGLQDLVADLVGGMVIILEKPYQVGDKIYMGEYYGEVTDIGIRATKIFTPDANLVSAPNNMIFTRAVASASAGTAEMMVVIDLYIDSDSDTVLAMKILREAAMTSKYVFVSKKSPLTILLKDYPFYRRLQAKAYVNDLRYQFVFESDVTKRAWDEFSKQGIKAAKVNILDIGDKGK